MNNFTWAVKKKINLSFYAVYILMVVITEQEFYIFKSLSTNYLKLNFFLQSLKRALSSFCAIHQLNFVWKSYQWIIHEIFCDKTFITVKRRQKAFAMATIAVGRLMGDCQQFELNRWSLLIYFVALMTKMCFCFVSAKPFDLDKWQV